MSLLSESEQRQVSEAIDRIEVDTDAEVVTVLAGQADDYKYIPLLWAALIALVVPGAINYLPGWLAHHQLLLVQWALFVVLAVLFRLPQVAPRLIPRNVRHGRACNLARRQFIEQNLHHTEKATGMLIFVSEAERYVEILVDRGISSRVDNAVWEGAVARFTEQVRAGKTLQGFLDCIETCGAQLKHAVPATHERNELPNRLIVLD
ncbi:TPM domain-containing protein [Stutzerimonas tarimensis]|uniref:TPM domain-containing protein n=1 Tax=Stutzerimonas tarimensis TaxID=1507735 RepID=A0ABV7T312_9GAMM